MVRIKITSLPEDQKVSKEVLRNVMGGGSALDDLSKMNSLRMLDIQAALTQYNQMMTAISNASKKSSQAADSIIGNFV